MAVSPDPVLGEIPHGWKVGWFTEAAAKYLNPQG
jgi:hypothetical protein